VRRVTAKKRMVAKLKSHQGRASTPQASSLKRGRCLASEGRQWLLPIPCCARKSRSGAHLPSACGLSVAKCSSSSQSTRTQEMGPAHSDLRQVATTTPYPAPLPSDSLLRHPSFIRAACVDAHVRICAGGGQR
jgi:hypothetical protein